MKLFHKCKDFQVIEVLDTKYRVNPASLEAERFERVKVRCRACQRISLVNRIRKMEEFA